MARLAFISRREGRYVFAIRTPACLKSVYRSGSIRLALGTANYQMASTRAGLIASWLLRIKTVDDDPRKALLELWPRPQAFAAEPVRNDDDYVERAAFQRIAFEVQFLVRQSGAKPDSVVPGWEEHFVMLVRENGRAGFQIQKSNSLTGRIERRREELFSQGADLVVSPPGATQVPFNSATVAAAVSAAMPPDGNRSRLSEVLKKFLDWREGEDGDRRAANDVAPIVQFAIELWKDPCIGDIGPDQLVMLKQAMPEVPTPAGFLDVRSIFQRWSIATANNCVIESDGKKIKLARVSASKRQSFPLHFEFYFDILPSLRNCLGPSNLSGGKNVDLPFRKQPPLISFVFNRVASRFREAVFAAVRFRERNAAKTVCSSSMTCGVNTKRRVKAL